LFPDKDSCQESWPLFATVRHLQLMGVFLNIINNLLSSTVSHDPLQCRLISRDGLGYESGEAAVAEKRKPISAVEVKTIKEPGSYFAGNGLYLHVSDTLTKSWIYRFMLKGRAREMGLGSAARMRNKPIVSFAEAKDLAWEAKKLVSRKIDPIEARRAERAEAQRVKDRKTFRQALERFIDNHERIWKDPRYATLWRQQMENHAYPTIGDMWGDEITTQHVLSFIEPLWKSIPRTGMLVLHRMEMVFDDLIVRGERTAANPARWKNYLDASLPAPSQVQPSKPQPSLPHERLFEFMIALRQTDVLGARPLEFLILTALRSDEVLKVRWTEIDEKARLLSIIPKGRRESDPRHRVPLSNRALEIIEEMKRFRRGDYLFPGRTKNKPLSNSIMLLTLSYMKWEGIVSHGFRATFDTWATECGYGMELVELALAHKVAVKAAAEVGVNAQIRKVYQRADLLEARRPLMDAWAQFTLTGKYPSTYLPPLAAE
jgi:integrase